MHCYHLSDHFVAGAREVKDHVAAVELAGWGSRFARRFALRQRSRRRSGRRWWRRLGRSRLGQLCCRLSQLIRLLLRRVSRASIDGSPGVTESWRCRRRHRRRSLRRAACARLCPSAPR